MPEKKNDKYIPLYFVAAFAVVFAVNGVFVYKATQTHTGLVTENAYEKGRDYNDIIALADAQEDLDGKIFVKNKQIVFTADLQQADVTAHISRPTQAGFDYVVDLTGADGEFTGDAKFPMQGQWVVAVVAKWEGKQYQTSKTVIVN